MAAMGEHRIRRHAPTGLVVALAMLVLPAPHPASAQLCPDVPHVADPVALDCASENERWAVIDERTGLVTNVVGWNGTNLWRPPAGQFARDLPDGSPVGPGWWLVDGTFVRDSFERNVTARADILSVHLSWSTGGLGTDSGAVTFTVDVQPTGQRFTLNDTRLTVDPLEAGVAHTFTVAATRADGSTVTGPVVTATPQADPDPDCTDQSVARECRAATNWAHVVAATGMVENVSVCTPAVCGDPASEFVRSFAARGIVLVELTGPGGIGWQYVDGTFVDVRPIEDPDADPEQAPAAPRDPDERTWAVVEDATGMVVNVVVWDGRTAYDPGPGVTLVELDGQGGIGWQYVDGTFVDVRPVEDELLGLGGSDDTASDDAASGPPSTVGTEDAPATTVEDPAETTEEAPLASRRAPTTPLETSDAAELDADEPAAREQAPSNPVRRLIDAIASFFRGLFGG